MHKMHMLKILRRINAYKLIIVYFEQITKESLDDVQAKIVIYLYVHLLCYSKKQSFMIV